MKTTNDSISLISLAILGLVHQNPWTGYDLKKFFSTTPMGHFSSSPGAIYPALERLKKSGWITGTIHAQHPLRPKQVYTLTAAGQEALRRHLRRPVTVEDVVWRLDDLFLRFGFMDQVLPRQDILLFLEEFLAAVEAHAATLRHYLEAAGAAMSLSGRLAMEKGVSDYENHAQWLSGALQQFQGSAPQGGGASLP